MKLTIATIAMAATAGTGKLPKVHADEAGAVLKITEGMDIVLADGTNIVDGQVKVDGKNTMLTIRGGSYKGNKYLTFPFSYGVSVYGEVGDPTTAYVCDGNIRGGDNVKSPSSTGSSVSEGASAVSVSTGIELFYEADSYSETMLYIAGGNLRGGDSPSGPVPTEDEYVGGHALDINESNATITGGTFVAGLPRSYPDKWRRAYSLNLSFDLYSPARPNPPANQIDIWGGKFDGDWNFETYISGYHKPALNVYGKNNLRLEMKDDADNSAHLRLIGTLCDGSDIDVYIYGLSSFGTPPGPGDEPSMSPAPSSFPSSSPAPSSTSFSLSDDFPIKVYNNTKCAGFPVFKRCGQNSKGRKSSKVMEDGIFG